MEMREVNSEHLPVMQEHVTSPSGGIGIEYIRIHSHMNTGTEYIRNHCQMSYQRITKEENGDGYGVWVKGYKIAM